MLMMTKRVEQKGEMKKLPTDPWARGLSRGLGKLGENEEEQKKNVGKSVTLCSNFSLSFLVFFSALYYVSTLLIPSISVFVPMFSPHPSGKVGCWRPIHLEQNRGK